MALKDRTVTGWLSDQLAFRGFEDMNTDDLVDMAAHVLGQDRVGDMVARLPNTMFTVQGNSYLCGVCTDLGLIRVDESSWRPCWQCNSGTSPALSEEF